MKKKVLVYSLVLALLFSSITGLFRVNLAKANPFELTYLPEITIRSDGNITPYTQLINRAGNTYTLTANIDGYGLVIERSNVVFDGAGHSINTTTGDTPAMHLSNVVNVAVKNLEIFSRYTSIYLYYSSNCLLTDVKTNNRIYLTDGSNSNTITRSNVRILHIGLIGPANNNLIIKNNILHELGVGGSSNKFFQNNFLLEDSPGILSDNSWDNGSVGNYWENYSIKYPNASEIGNTGIGDTPYIIDRSNWTMKWSPNATNIDYYPLMYPWGAPKVTVFNLENATYFGSVPLNFSVSKSSQWTGYSLDGGDNVTVTGNTTLNDLTTGFHNLTVYAKDAFGDIGASENVKFNVDSELFPIASVAAVSVAVVALVVAGLVVYRKRKLGLVKKA